MVGFPHPCWLVQPCVMQKLILIFQRNPQKSRSVLTAKGNTPKIGNLTNCQWCNTPPWRLAGESDTLNHGTRGTHNIIRNPSHPCVEAFRLLRRCGGGLTGGDLQRYPLSSAIKYQRMSRKSPSSQHFSLNSHPSLSLCQHLANFPR